MLSSNLTHNAWAHVHAHACTVACVAAAAPDLRTLAGWLAGRLDIADARESERSCGSNASADREGRAD